LDSRWNFTTEEEDLGGAGTQTAGLAFGGNYAAEQVAEQKNIMDLLGQSWRI
jgi:hypothetical protein